MQLRQIELIDGFSQVQMIYLFLIDDENLVLLTANFFEPELRSSAKYEVDDLAFQTALGWQIWLRSRLEEHNCLNWPSPTKRLRDVLVFQRSQNTRYE